LRVGALLGSLTSVRKSLVFATSIFALVIAMLAAGSAVRAATTSATGASSLATNAKAVLEVKPLGFVWDTLDPFLFCVFHHDVFPAAGADGKIPQNLLRGRNIGQDFELRDGFRMYHGTRGIPGFPSHPHFVCFCSVVAVCSF
jgi:hypothetical protein